MHEESRPRTDGSHEGPGEGQGLSEKHGETAPRETDRPGRWDRGLAEGGSVTDGGKGRAKEWGGREGRTRAETGSLVGSS
ncbi:hypothetical protein NDU88_001303 [Pleurodeles waltl]|uniref:Uncharacterized protein n=1 Tax=Pleurodeles waltl TaxID=8319 RepID=A0AAV7SAK3_PLEWA|nr:hypothetical protein NDU88_001303 [Pleurodeles waltl]